jgi:hypothetical protein
MFSALKPLFVLTCVSTTLQAAKAPAEFLDIPWRASPAKAKEILSKRPEVHVTVDTPTKIVGEGGIFAGYPVERIELELQDGAFVTGTVFLIIPAEKDKNGVPLRNQLFDSLSKSLGTEYGKVQRENKPTHTEENWSWVTTEPLASKKMETTIHLSYSWAPYEFIVRYAIHPVTAAPTAGPKVQKKNKDL